MTRRSITQQGISKAAGGLAAWAIRHPVGVIMITLAVVVLGLFSLTRLSVNLLPDLIYPDIRVRVIQPGTPAKVMEDQITRQLEEQLAITEDVISVESTSSEGRSAVNLSFQYGKNIDVALRDASTRLDRAKRFLPTDIDPPIIYKRDPSQRPVLEYVVSSDSMDAIALRNWVDNVFSKWFITLPGVAASEVGGGLIREIQVLPDQQRLAGLGLTTDDIIEALKKGNQEEPAGRIKLERRELSSRISARFESIEDIASLPIEIANEQYIYLRDIAEIRDTHETERLRVRLDGVAGIKVSIQKQPSANAVTVVDTVNDRLQSLIQNRVIPEHIRVKVVGDQSVFVRNAINNASLAATSGAILAMLIVYLFLGNIKRTLIIGSAIPIAITVTFLIMDIGGLTLNIMTLGGLAIGVGMLVDSTIVMLENIYRHQTEGEDSFEAGTHAAREVNSAIVASTSTNLAAIIPFLFISGLFGLFFRELIFTITAAIIAAMIVALTLVPALATRLRFHGERDYSFMDRAIAKLQVYYERSLRFFLNQTWPKVIMILLLVAALLFAIHSLGSNQKKLFLPELDDGRIGIRIEADAGTKLDITDVAVRHAEELIGKMPAVQTTFTIAGGFIFGRTEVEARHRGRIDVQLVPLPERNISSNEWIRKFKKILKKNKLPGIRIRARKLRLPGTRFHRGDEDVSLRISGPKLDTLETIGHQLGLKLRQLNSISNTYLSTEEINQELSIRIDRERAINMGFTNQQVSTIIKTAVDGTVATDFIDGDRSYDIRVKLPDIDTSNLAQLGSILLGGVRNTSSAVYLSDLATIELIQAPHSIKRDSQQRIIEISANVTEGYTQGQAIASIQNVLDEFELPIGYQVYEAGISQTLKQTQHTVYQLLALAIFLVLVVMAVQYESLRNPLIILLGIPFTAIGVATAVAWNELPLSTPLWLGVIMLTGIVVNNAIILVEYIEIVRREGKDILDAIATAARLRLRPILMTSLTTIIGLSPLAIGFGEGHEMLKPLAIAITSGLAFSLLISLYLIPSIYQIVHGRLRA